MPEHSPAPRPERGIYGFALFLVSVCLIVLYLIWAFVPFHILEQYGLSYWPDKYWALAVPIYSCILIFCGLLFLFGYNLIVLSDVFDSVEFVQHDFGLPAEISLNYHRRLELNRLLPND